MRWIAIACVLSGCAWIAQSQVRKYERKVISYEQLQPDAEALGRGDTRTTFDMVELMDDWRGHIEQQELPPIERQKLVDRLGIARKRYLLAASQLTDTPDLGYAIATMVLDEGDAEALAIVRGLADGRGERRQKVFGETRSYSMVKQGETTMAVTSSSASFRNGRQVRGHETRSLVLKSGNCVFATRPFSSEGVANPGLTFRVVGKAPVVHARCYVNRELAALPPREGQLLVSVTGRGAIPTQTITLPRVSAEGMPAVDFVLRGDMFDDRLPFLATQVVLSYSYTRDIVAVPDRNGVLRMRKERPEIELSRSPLFWDRDGTLPAHVTAPTSGTRGSRALAAPAPAPAARPDRSPQSARRSR